MCYSLSKSSLVRRALIHGSECDVSFVALGDLRGRIPLPCPICAICELPLPAAAICGPVSPLLCRNVFRHKSLHLRSGRHVGAYVRTARRRGMDPFTETMAPDARGAPAYGLLLGSRAEGLPPQLMQSTSRPPARGIGSLFSGGRPPTRGRRRGGSRPAPGRGAVGAGAGGVP